MVMATNTGISRWAAVSSSSATKASDSSRWTRALVAETKDLLELIDE
jgi:hypothetical protein